ncbi:ankyrin-3-like [Ptychodera flava]|uniref:ankyrin-3-like n=1 Tax=Ptychodera flava TaxID=63121 RepID=UPI003969BEDB
MVDNIICESIAFEQYYSVPVLPPEEESLIVKSEEQTKSSQSLSECTFPEIVITTADDTESVEDRRLTEDDETMATRNETMVTGIETKSTNDKAVVTRDETVSRRYESISTEDEILATDDDADEACAMEHETMVTRSQTVARLCETKSITDETLTPDDDAKVGDVTMATDDGSEETNAAEDETMVTRDDIKAADEDEKVTDVTMATATEASEKIEIFENAPLDHSSVTSSVQEGNIDLELHGITTSDTESHHIPEILSKVDEHLYGLTDRASKENNGTPTVLTAMEPDSSTEALNAYQDVTMATSDQSTHSMRTENKDAQDAKPGLTHMSGDVTPKMTYTDTPSEKTQLSGDVTPTSWTSENGFPRDRADTSENDIAPSRHQGAIPKQHSPRRNKQRQSKGDTPRSVSMTTTEENYIPQTEHNMATTESAAKQQELVEPGNLGKENRDEFENYVETLEHRKKTEQQTDPLADALSAESKFIEVRQRGNSSTSVGSSDRDVDTASDISADSSEGNRMTKSIQASPSISADAEYFGKLFDAVAKRDKRTSLELMKCVDLTRRRDGFTLLHMAAKHDVLSVVSGLYTYGAFGQLVEVRAGKETGRFQGLTARDIAEKGRHSGIVRQIDKFYEYEYSLDPLHHAARSGNIDALTKLCENRGNVNVVGNHGNTPLYMAACAGRLKSVQLLLKYGADVTVVCNREKTILHKAAEWGHYDVVQFFVSQCHIDVNARSKDGITPLHLAAAYGNTDIVTFLLDHKASSTIRSHYRESPLFWAVAHGNVDVVQLLVQRGARAELQPHSSLAPQDWNFLHVAASSGHVDTCQYLLDRNFDIRSVTSREMEMNGYYAKGVTALHLAAGHGHQNVINFLIECGADVNARDTQRCTPLHYASQFGHQHAVQQLLHDRADTNAPDHHLLTPLHKAALNGHAEVSEILIHKGARLDIRASSKHSECIPLHMAAAGGHYDTALLLLKRGTPVNAIDSNKQTALHFAAKNGHLDIVRLLFSSGASLNCKDQKGDTPLTLALKKNHWEVTKFLKGIGAIGRTPIRQKFTRFSFGSPRS